MRLFILTVIQLMCCLIPLGVTAQITDREIPEEWKGLVHGGRFMDRFLPMPTQGKLTQKTWGADHVIPRYIDNGIEDGERSYWGGNALLGADGKYHLFVCRWREDAKGGHKHWPNSHVVHAVADQPTGPYKVKDSIGPGHNPEAFRLKDGRYVIYVINGYYIADSVDGPWKRERFEFNKRDRRIIEGLSNLSFAQREDGSYLMVCRGGGIWFSETGISSYNQITDKRVYPLVPGNFEDPVVWRTDIQYHMIVNDWRGRIAYYLRSKDGIDWTVDPGEAYLPGIANYEDGTIADWYKYERIKVLQDEHGRAVQAHFAVIDVAKGEDKGSDNHSSKHICIPLTKGRLLTLLNKKPITSDTKKILVRIAAEDDFNPHKDIDVESLRFGASEEVNFGRGTKVLETKRSGTDLIVAFDSEGNGITERNFVGKLMGKTHQGKLLFGYTRLPGVDYLEPALSARAPQLTKTKNGFGITVEVQNVGQTPSQPAHLEIVSGKGDKKIKVSKGPVPPLKPFQKMTIELTCGDLFEKGVAYELMTILNPAAATPVTLRSKATPVP